LKKYTNTGRWHPEKIGSKKSDDEILIVGAGPAGIKSLARIGDCLAPGTIASAVFFGHKFAREFYEPDPGDVPFKREINVVGLQHRKESPYHAG
jgi:hypothetical protein